MASREWMSSDREIYKQVDDWSYQTLNIRENFKYNLRNNPYVMRNRSKAIQTMIEYNEMMYAYCCQVRNYYGAGNKEHQHIVNHFEKQLAELTTRFQDEKKAKEDALTRVSELASKMLKSGNASIIELSDPHRPMKLAEEFSAIYDDEWTDAFEFLTEHKDMKDEETIDLLFNILKICHNHTLELADSQLSSMMQSCIAPQISGEQTSTPVSKEQPVQDKPLSSKEPPVKQTVGQKKKGVPEKKGTAVKGPETKGPVAKEPPVQESTDELESEQSKLEVSIKEFRRSAATEAVDSVVTSVTQTLAKQNYPPEILSNPDVTKYYRKCARLTWLMHAQFPPMHVRIDVEPGSAFNSDMFKEYRQRGSKIGRMVWPALCLHKGGPLVSKGTADGDGSK